MALDHVRWPALVPAALEYQVLLQGPFILSELV